ncbi:MAG: hypothetical protein JO254_04325, partial [Pseudolabrys sp.]|nr:hypothetical protein [Pseudolabrys sp.]
MLPGRYYYGFRSVEDGRDIGFPIRVIEGRTGVLSVFGDGSFELNNAKYTGGLGSGAWGDIGYSAELIVGRPIKRALVIGAGHGDVIVAFANLPGNPIVDVAELSDEVIAVQRDPAMAKSGREYFRGAYGVDVHVIDGRRWVNEGLARGLRYDVIQLGINNPGTGTSGNLYTREMFEKMHELLADDGVLMVYSFGSALRTGLEVFAHAYYLSGIPYVAAFTGQVFMTKRPVQSPVWR